MDKTKFLTIFGTFGNLPLTKQTLPSIIEETVNADAKLIVHDSTVGPDREAKWEYLRNLADEHSFFLILSSNVSMAHARNMCMHTGIEMYAPDVIAMMEDDHGYKPGFIGEMLLAVNEHYGEISPNGLRYGLFTGCSECNKGNKVNVENTSHLVRDKDQPIGLMGGANSCYRCAPTSHWISVLKGYDTDEYPISKFQTSGINARNYNKGFTCLILDDGKKMFSVEAEGRGVTSNDLPLWDDNYCASDTRSKFKGKEDSKSSIQKSLIIAKTKIKQKLKKALK